MTKLNSTDTLKRSQIILPHMPTHMNILICSPQDGYLILIYPFLNNIFFELGSVCNASLKPAFCISFSIFGPTFGIQGKVIVRFSSVLQLLLLLILRVFFSKLLIIFCDVFRSYPFSQNIQSDILFPPSNIFQSRSW